jgi:hypothetical protein
MLWRLYSYDTLLEPLGQHFEDMPVALRQLIQQEDAVVGQGDLARQRHRPAADQAGIRDGVGRDTAGWSPGPCARR